MVYIKLWQSGSMIRGLPMELHLYTTEHSCGTVQAAAVAVVTLAVVVLLQEQQQNQLL
jgi:hypothetical protein